MGKIFNSFGSKVGEIESDGVVFGELRERIGSVSGSGEVRNNNGNVMGKYYSNGDVYAGANCVGKVYDDGSVEYYGKYIGKIVGSNLKSGGAALILLLNK